MEVCYFTGDYYFTNLLLEDKKWFKCEVVMRVCHIMFIMSFRSYFTVCWVIIQFILVEFNKEMNKFVAKWLKNEGSWKGHIGARRVHIGVRIVPAEGRLGFDIYRRPREGVRRPNARSNRKLKRCFHGPVPFQFLMDVFHYKYKPYIKWLCL